MDSKFGALQYIVLPAGATSGRRIILDGVNGTISIYDINGLLLARMGFADSIELFSRQANEVLGADIQAAAIGSAANPARRAELVLESPNLTGGAGGGNRSQLEMLSESFETGAEGTVAATTGGDDLKVEQTLLGLSAGTHIIAAFYIRALGTGNVTLDVATGQNRELYVEASAG